MPKRWILLIVFSFISALIVFILWAALSQQELTAYKPDSYGSYGLKALELLLNKSGLTTVESDILENDYEQLVIYVSNSKSTAQSRRRILEWVKSGGTVMELARFKPQLDLDTEPVILKQSKPIFDFNDPAAGLKYHPGGEMIYTGAVFDTSLIYRDEQVIVYLNQYEAGRVINWNDPDGITNIHLKKYPDNAVIFTLIAAKYADSGRIVFYNPNPFHEKKDLETGLQSNYWYAGTFIGLGIILLLWKLSSRFGRPHPLVLAKGRSSDEFVYSMAALFQQADSKAMVLDNLYRELMLAISKITNLPLDSDWNLMFERFTLIVGKNYDSRKIFVAVEIYHKNKGRKVKTPVFLELARKLDAYRKELNQWNP